MSLFQIDHDASAVCHTLWKKWMTTSRPIK